MVQVVVTGEPGVQGARLCVDCHQAVVLAQLTLGTALRVYQPTLYLELSLKVNTGCSLHPLLTICLLSGATPGPCSSTPPRWPGCCWGWAESADR